MTLNGWATISLLAVAAGCHHATTGTVTPSVPEVSSVTVAVFALPDSTIKLAKFAMGTIDGVVQVQQIRNSGVAVSTHYTRSRRGGGQLEIAIVAALSRQVADSMRPVTIVELSGWVVETREALVLPQRRGSSLTGQRPPVAMAANRPRPITASDTTDWQNLGLVLEEFIKHGAQRSP